MIRPTIVKANLNANGGIIFLNIQANIFRCPKLDALIYNLLYTWKNSSMV